MVTVDAVDDRLHRWLARHRRVFALTGAGCSTASGIPDYRDDQGEWKRRPPIMSQAFRTQAAVYRRYWARAYIGWPRLATAAPNTAHHAFAAWEAAGTLLQLVTQNVDGLHQRAGSRNVAELHGNITRTKCFEEGTVVESWPETIEVPPRCPRCGGWLRPDVVWFGEMLPEEELTRALNASRCCEVLFSVGTSALVHPAASLPLEALDAGAWVVEINPQRTPLSPRVDYFLEGASGAILPALLKAAWPAQTGG